MTEEERAMLAEVAEDAAYRNRARRTEINSLRYTIIGFFLAGLVVVAIAIIGWFMDRK